jgi:hypothetical protein
MYNANIKLHFYVLILWFKSSYNRKIFGKISYVLFMTNFHNYISIYRFYVYLNNIYI